MSSKKSNVKIKVVLMICISVFIVSLSVFLNSKNKDKDSDSNSKNVLTAASKSSNSVQLSQSEESSSLSSVKEVETKNSTVANSSKSVIEATPKIAKNTNPTTNYKVFTALEFQTLYDNFNYLKVTPITQKPSIRGDAKVDQRIQSIAETRGYKLRAEAQCKCLNVEAQTAWQKLKQAAVSEGINIDLQSGFRSIADQKSIFNNQIASYSNQQIAAGLADENIDEVLTLYSIPGYSKHHTGYTIDFGCVDNGVVRNWSGANGFKSSNCFRWLEANNYYNAKRFGFIPSYPEGAVNQGPNPESWEYVWVGTEVLK